ncbi:RecBCD enzyme subunit RecD [Methanosarcinaceae archaeon Ag5]|uniref:RecBCD enzyme subunit RecD n=1 Tax=Methanolapillus africanus TaxID=3028297 RepID=A0AAE4SCD9_9EURY|nr:RecBCD enzyme subunit RecD [Methanosarcinaceae archaeon Ag5]
MVDALYYAGFGVSDREASHMKDGAFLTLRDHEWYLKKAIDKRQNEQYQFTYAVESVKFRITFDESKVKPTIQKLEKANKELKVIKYESESHIVHIKGRLPAELKCLNESSEMVSFKNFEVLETTLENLEAYVRPEENKQAEMGDLKVHAGLVENKSSDDITEKILAMLYSSSGSVYDGDDKVIIRGTDEKKETMTIKGSPKRQILDIRTDVYQLKKQKESIQRLVGMPHPYHLPLINLLLDEKHAHWGDVSSDRVQKWNFLKDLDGSNEQKEFVEKALNSPDFSILVGPPGSGKTATLIELISQLIAEGKRILLVASTHVAVDNVLERIVENNLNEELGIVPIRIGREEVVSEKVSGYRLDSVVHSTKDRWLKKLETISSQRTFEPFEEELHQSLKSKDGNDVIKNVILDTSNLVCGTTFGILQAPMIKEKNSYLPPFDVMILDEASKTTFQEFLIPALHAKKWVISGDPKQLAPYVNSDFLISSLGFRCDDLRFSPELRDVCLNVFNSKEKSENRSKDGSKPDLYCKVIVLDDDCPYFDQIREQIQYLSQQLEDENAFPLTTVVDSHPIPEDVLRQIMVSKAVFVKQSLFDQIKNLLPPLSEIVGEKELILSNSWTYQRNFFAEKGRNQVFGMSDRDWEGEIVWRLSRMYEMSSSGNDKKHDYLKKDIKMLFPGFNLTDIEYCRKELDKSINNLQKIEIPSIIDLLIHGFGNNDGNKKDIILYTGLPEKTLKNRMVELSYQHRMNPQISEFPREHVYDNKALIDGGEMKHRKICEIGYGSHSFIRNCVCKERSGNINMNEADAIMKELQKIKKWTKEHPKEDGPWSVAILTFYRKQEMHLANLMRKEQPGGRKFFDLKDFNLEVVVANVDRFQGHEADIVLLSFVRSRKHGGVGFLDNRNRLNVAITRARHYLIVYADKDFYKGRRDILGNFMQSLGEDIRYKEDES